MAGWTGLEPATSDVTGRRSSEVNYHPAKAVGCRTPPAGLVRAMPAECNIVNAILLVSALRHYAWVRRVCGLLLLGARRSHLLHSITPTVFGRASLLYGEGRRSSLLARRFFGGRFVGRPGVSARSRSMCAPQLAKAAASSGSRRDRL